MHEFAPNAALALRGTNTALGILGFLLILNHVTFCRFESCGRVPFISSVGAAETREISNLEITMLASATTLITASFLVRYATGHASYLALQLSLFLPFAAVIGLSFDTKRHQTIHALWGQITTVLVAVLALKGTFAISFTAVYCFLLVFNSLYHRKLQHKNYSQAKRVFYQVQTMIQSALVFTFGYAIIARNSEIADTLRLQT